MKKILYITLLLGCTVNAQLRNKNDIEFIPFIGVANSNYFGSEDVRNNKSLFAPVFGINAD